MATAHLTIHEAVCDALLRMGQGIDDNNPELLASAFTVDAVCDMTASSFLSPHFGLLSGRDAIVAMTSHSVCRMDTTHMLQNFRTTVSADGGSAHLTCYVLAHHWRPGHGRSYAFAGCFTMGNRFECELVLEGGLWRMKTFIIRPQWTEGDFGVFDMDSWGLLAEAVKAAADKKF